MIVFLDVDYRHVGAMAACVVARDWIDATPALEVIAEIPSVAEYEPGQFYKRELPCLLAVLNKLSERPALIVVDSYVWLGKGDVPGMGAHLYEALGRTISVVGVAKTRFQSAITTLEVFRGGSKNPLFVSAAGMDPAAAVEAIRMMHGLYRIPTLIKRVDQLCRNSQPAS